MLGVGNMPGVLVLCGLLGVWLTRRLRSQLAYRKVLRDNGCAEPPKYPHKDPIFGIDLFLEIKKAFEDGHFLEINKKHYDSFGKSFKANAFGSTTIKTVDPEVSKLVFSTQFNKFGLQPLRHETAKNLFGNGIIVVDGPSWAHARKLIRSSFEVVHISNFENLGQFVDRFMDLLPQDGSTIDLLPLFKRLILDTTTDFIFGESIEALSSTPLISETFMDSFAYAQRGVGLRAMLGRLKFLHRDKKWWQACRKVTDFCDQQVDKAFARKAARENKESAHQDEKKNQRLQLIDEMVEESDDRLDLRSQILAVFSPAHDGAAVTLSNAFFHICRQPEVWEKLRAEILPTKAQLLTYELLNSYKYLDHVLRETHRLTPVATFNQRVCLESTVFPIGGGPDGKAPLYVQKGDVVEINYRAMQRDKDIWGDDSEEFRPERWATIRPTWEYTPFGGGPRTCPGIRLVYTESAYVIARMVRQFSKLENRDPIMEWQEEMRLTFQSRNGTKVGLLV